MLDEKIRLEATDPSQSFIVQAPAGSGKTEILTQRYLRLLATVDKPQKIVALTFTRKAANEMRQRVLRALQKAHANYQSPLDHENRTIAIAKECLALDKKYNWQILESSNILRITTIDALSQNIAKAIWQIDSKIYNAKIHPHPEVLYQKAAINCLQYALKTPEYQTALSTLLLHLDNKQETLINLWVEVLRERDKWQQVVFAGREQSRQQMEEMLKHIANNSIKAFNKTIPEYLKSELFMLVQRIVGVENIKSLDHLPSLKTIAAILTTQQGNLRKSFDHHVGLTKDKFSAQEFAILKKHSKDLLESLDQIPEFISNVRKIKQIPDLHYQEDSWQILQTLFKLLPMVFAHLAMVLEENNAADFTAIALSALHALGTEDEPSDLGLYLDYNIEHLLVDEFQDTSLPQFYLLKRLTQGFTPGDGRSVFIVGDPMQSIYRFRAAEVSVFLRVCAQGLGQLPLKYLELKCNFRSDPLLVDFINTKMNNIFPQENNIDTCAIKFSTAYAAKTPNSCACYQAQAFSSKLSEAQAILDCIKHEIKHFPEHSIAILVRNRKQLSAIIPMLNQHHIPFQGVEIASLSNLACVQDVWSLTQSLLMPDSRLAWLAVLRSPFCGLNMQDLHAVANFNTKESIYFALLHIDEIENLSMDAKNKLRFVAKVLTHAIQNRQQTTLSTWVLATIKELHGDALFNNLEYLHLEQYWQLLEEFSHDGLIVNLDLFQTKLSTLMAQHSQMAKLQIMTIHKAKGLEFDTVILPGLGSKTLPLKKSLLRWQTVISKVDEHLLISPLKASYEETSSLYDYLGILEMEKYAYEQQRLLYVALTRAKARLFLFDYKIKADNNSLRKLLSHVDFALHEDNTDLALEHKTITLSALPTSYYMKLPQYQQITANPISMGESSAKIIGIVTHKILQWVCTYHPRSFEELPKELMAHYLRPYSYDAAITTKVMDNLNKIFNSDIGRWIINSYKEEYNEYEIIVRESNILKTYIIDRMFYDNNICWLIDFKTGAEHSLEYQKQLRNYARLIKSQHNNGCKINCGIYYINEQIWEHFSYENT
jgi:ATP-dependent exoDNAse (exonuclease V) beta subunit